MSANDSEHIWLRQTVTFTVNGQTRTLEIGIPLPRNASAQDVEALLGVADAGMSALSRRLDAQVTEALAEDASTQIPMIDTASARAIPAAPATTPVPTHEAPSANGYAPREPIDTAPAPTAEPDSALPHEKGVASQPHAPNVPSRADTATPRTSAPPPAPERTPKPQRPDAVAPRPQAPSTPPAIPAARSALIASEMGVEMTRAQFLASAGELGLNPRQAMDQLGVRSLEGLNLREALESLRRQLLGAASAAESEVEIAPEPEPVAPAAATSAAPRYFEEEDDETIPYSLDEETDDDDETIGDDFASSVSSRSANKPLPAGEDDPLDDIDLEDVPDLSPPASARQRATPATRKASTAATEPPTTATEAAPTGSGRTQAMQLIGKLRAATGGGPASDYQRNAYHNIVEDELGKPQATALVRGLWRTTLDRLSSGQLEALIRWGKEEVFAEEAAQVIATLRAEQRRAEQADAAANHTDQPAEPRAATRSRPSGGSR